MTGAEVILRAVLISPTVLGPEYGTGTYVLQYSTCYTTVRYCTAVRYRTVPLSTVQYYSTIYEYGTISKLACRSRAEVN